MRRNDRIDCCIQAAAKLYMDAIDELRASGDGSAHSEFEFVWLRARTAREFANDAQEQMRAHAVIMVVLQVDGFTRQRHCSLAVGRIAPL